MFADLLISWHFYVFGIVGPKMDLRYKKICGNLYYGPNFWFGVICVAIWILRGREGQF
jgi:hypothetical protein